MAVYLTEKYLCDLVEKYKSGIHREEFALTLKTLAHQILQYAKFKYDTGPRETERQMVYQCLEKAQNYIRRAIIGLIITFSAWAIWSFVLSKFILAA